MSSISARRSARESEGVIRADLLQQNSTLKLGAEPSLADPRAKIRVALADRKCDTPGAGKPKAVFRRPGAPPPADLESTASRRVGRD